MTPPTPLPPRLRYRPFSIQEGALHGLTAARLRGKDLPAPFNGIRSCSSLGDPVDLARAYLPRLRPGDHFSHVTAAAIWGIPLPLRVTQNRELAVHVTTVGRDASHRARRVVGHRSSRAPMLFLAKGFAVPSPLDVWLTLWRVLDRDELIVAGDAVVNPHGLGGAEHGIPTTRDELRDAVAALRGRNGARRLAEALEEIREGSRSAKETEARLAFVRGGVREPILNADVVDSSGRWLGQADMVFGLERIVVEYEGDQHRTDKKTWRSDLERRERFEDAGWRVVRVTGGDAAEGFVRPIARLIVLQAERSPEA